MKRVNLISEITISGVSEGGLLFNRESIGDLQLFMDNQQFSGRIMEAYRELRKHH
jgi:hypothetical protein